VHKKENIDGFENTHFEGNMMGFLGEKP